MDTLSNIPLLVLFFRMNRIRRKKTKDFTTISNVFFRDKSLSLKAKGMLALIMSLPDDWDFSVLGVTRIIKESKNTVYSAINELKEKGYCSLERFRDEKGVIIGYDYTFFEYPENISDPLTKNPQMDNPQMDFCTQINKKEINTKTTKDLQTKEKVKRKGGEQKKARSLEDRKTEFGVSLKPYTQEFGGKYPREMISDFFRYWSEANRSQTRMRFEMEKTWEVGKRLATWASRDRKFNTNSYGRETVTDKMRRTIAEAEDFDRQLTAKREAEMGNGDSKPVW